MGWEFTGKIIFSVLAAVLLFYTSMSPLGESYAITTGSLTNVDLAPAYNTASKGTQIGVGFTVATNSPITKVVITLPSDFSLSAVDSVVKNVINPGTVSVTGGATNGGGPAMINYTLPSPQTMTSGTHVSLIFFKIVTPAAGHITGTVQTFNGANLVDSGTGTFNLLAPPAGTQGAKGATGPPGFTNGLYALNFGNTEFGSHPCNVNLQIENTFWKQHGIKLQMVNYLNDKPAYGQLAYADGDPFVGEIELFPYNFAPKGFMHADGSLLQISQNTALFSLLGTNFGGNGQTTFAIPDLRCMEPPNMQYDIALFGIFPSQN